MIDENSKKEFLELRLMGKVVANEMKNHSILEYHSPSSSSNKPTQNTGFDSPKCESLTRKRKNDDVFNEGDKKNNDVDLDSVISYKNIAAIQKENKSETIVHHSNKESVFNTDSCQSYDCQDITSQNTIKMKKNEVSLTYSFSIPWRNNDTLIAEYENKIATLNEKIGTLESNENNLKSVIISLVQNQIISQNNKRKKRILKNNVKLGHIITARVGVQFTDQWEKGDKFIKLENMFEKNRQLREELEKKKKTVSKISRNVNSSSNTNNYTSIETTTSVNDEIELIKAQLFSLKKEEGDLNIKMDKLNKDRNLHLRELRNQMTEKNSKFKCGQVLKNNSYVLMHAVGKGGFSEVFKAFDTTRSLEVACKFHQVSNEWREDRKNNYVRHALREFQIHQTLNHPNIVHLLDVFVIDNNTFVSIMEFCETDLDIMLKNHKQFQEKEAKFVISQIVSALKYLNQLDTPVIHYDLKPANVLFTDVNTWHIKITDFGLSKIMPRNIDNEMSGMELTSQGAGTYWYLPPECFITGKKPPKITSKVDVWSIGVIFYQMLYGVKPFGHNMSQPDIVENRTILNARNVTFKAKPAISNECKGFIKSSLTYSKDDRPDVLQLSEHVYLVNNKKSSDKFCSPTVTPSIPKPNLSIQNDSRSP